MVRTHLRPIAACFCAVTALAGVAMAQSGGDQGKWFNCGGGCGVGARKFCDVMACCCSDTSTSPVTYSCHCMDSDCDGLSYCSAGSQIGE